MSRSSSQSEIFGFFRRHRTLRSWAALASSVTLLGGCEVWRRTLESPRAVLARRPAVLRVVQYGGPVKELNAPRLSGDTLVGYDAALSDAVVVAIPLSRVERMEIRKVDGVRTALLVAAIGATGILALTADRGGGHSTSTPPPPPTGGGLDGPISCPLVYSWDGRHWRLDSGTFGGAIMRALQRTDVDNLDFATPQGTTLRLKMANELSETDHVDAVAVLAVDHAPGFAVAPDPAGGLHLLGALVPPFDARDFRGADALPRVRDADGWSWESSWSGRDPGRAADVRDGLELSFVRPHGAARAHLVLDGNSTPWSGTLLAEYVRAHGAATQAWYDSLNLRPALAQAVGMRLAREAFLSVSVRSRSGWRPQGMFWEASPELRKRQVLDLDLTQVSGDTVVVRLESAPAFWLVDRVALDFTPDGQLAVRELPLVSALDHAGVDVAPLLRALDDRDYVMEHGDGAELVFSVPPVPPGMTRDFLLRSTGWYRIDTPTTGQPEVARLNAIMRDSLGVSRVAVTRLNEELARLSQARR